jgi:hypothetical protein
MNMMMRAIRRVTVGVALLGALADVPAMAEGLPITPGLWEARTRDLVGEVDEVIERRCVRDGVFDLAAEMAKDGSCAISNKTIAGNGMEFDVMCEDDGMILQGHISTVIDEEEGVHEAVLAVDLLGSRSEMHTLTEWRRIGAC